MLKYIVYITINLENHKYYIGVHQTSNPYEFDNYLGCGMYSNFDKSGCSSSNYNTDFQKALQDGDVKNFRRFTLGIFDTPEEAYKVEGMLVSEELLKHPDVYNMTVGGYSVPTIETKVYKYDSNGGYLKSYDSIAKAAAAHNVSSAAIYNSIKRKIRAADFYWSYEQVEKLKLKESNHPGKYKVVYEYDLDGNLINEYNGTQPIAIKYGISNSVITRAIRAKYKVLGKYYFSNVKYDKFVAQKQERYRGKPVYLYNLDGTFAMEFKSASECRKYFGDSNESTFTNCRRMKRCYHDYIISMEKVDQLPEYIKINKRMEVDQYDLNGNFIKHYESIQQAVNEWGRGVSHVLDGSQTSTKGYIFKYSQRDNIASDENQLNQ